MTHTYEVNIQGVNNTDLIWWDSEFIEGTARTHSTIDTTQNVGDWRVREPREDVDRYI